MSHLNNVHVILLARTHLQMKAAELQRHDSSQSHHEPWPPEAEQAKLERDSVAVWEHGAANEG